MADFDTQAQCVTYGVKRPFRAVDGNENLHTSITERLEQTLQQGLGWASIFLKLTVAFNGGIFYHGQPIGHGQCEH